MNLTHTSQPRAWVSAGGRVFYVYDERHPRMAGAGSFNLVARDAFNGKLLWRKAVPGKFTWSNKIGTVVATDRLLVAPLGPKRSLLGLDPVTGETLVDYGTNAFSALACGDALIIKTAPLRVVDAATGKLRWTANTYYCGSIAADGDRVYAFFQRRTRPAGRTVQTWGVG
ncbi:MAG: outer membrane protein assembly factor BamB family protein, partial [Planctomycetota bacterium]